MPVEIERKFLVKPDAWAQVLPEKSVRYVQAYLLTDPAKTIRVRTAGQEAFLTIKGQNERSTRAEYEYAIPLQEAQELIHSFCERCVEKTRHFVPVGSHTWEVDEFEGDNAGLMVAEIELGSETEIFALPDWAGEEVTHDYRYLNSNLSKHPFCKWDAAHRKT